MAAGLKLKCNILVLEVPAATLLHGTPVADAPGDPDQHQVLANLWNQFIATSVGDEVHPGGPGGAVYLHKNCTCFVRLLFHCSLVPSDERAANLTDQHCCGFPSLLTV